MAQKFRINELQDGPWKFVVERLNQAKNDLDLKKKNVDMVKIDLKSAIGQMETVVGESKASQFLKQVVLELPLSPNPSKFLEGSLSTANSTLEKLEKEVKEPPKTEGKKQENEFIMKESRNIRKDLETWEGSIGGLKGRKKKLDEKIENTEKLLKDLISTATSPRIDMNISETETLLKDLKTDKDAINLIIGLASRFKLMMEDALNLHHAEDFIDERAAYDKNKGSDSKNMAYGRGEEIFKETFGFDLDAAKNVAVQLIEVQRYTALLDNTSTRAFERYDIMTNAINGKYKGDLNSYEKLYLDARKTVYENDNPDKKLDEFDPHQTKEGNLYSNYELYKLVSKCVAGVKKEFIASSDDPNAYKYFDKEFLDSFLKNENRTETQVGNDNKEYILVKIGDVVLIYSKKAEWVDIVADTEKRIMANPEFRKVREELFDEKKQSAAFWGSSLVRNLNARAQFELLMIAKKEMEKVGMTFDKREVRDELDNIIRILSPVPQLEGENLVQDITSQMGATKQFSSVGEAYTHLLADYDLGMRQTTVTVTLDDGTSEVVSGIITVSQEAQGKEIIVSNGETLSIGANGTISYNGTNLTGVKTVSYLFTMAITQTVEGVEQEIGMQFGKSKEQGLPSILIFQDAKLDGFFAFAMPVLAHYEKSARTEVVNAISDSELEIQKSYYHSLLDDQDNGFVAILDTNAVIANLTAARDAMRAFNMVLPQILLTTSAKYQSMGQIKDVSAMSDFSSGYNIVHRQMFNLYDEIAGDDRTMRIPIYHIRYYGVPYIEPFHGGMTYRPESEADARSHQYGGLAFMFWQDRSAPNISLDQYSFNLTPVVLKAMADAVPGFMENSPPELYFNRGWAAGSGLFRRTQSSDMSQINLYYRSLLGKNTMYDLDVSTSKTDFATGTFLFKGFNSPTFVLPSEDVWLRNVELAAQWKQDVINKMEIYLAARLGKNSNAALYFFKDNVTGRFSLRLGYRSSPKIEKSEDGKVSYSPANFRFITVAESLTKEEIATIFTQLDIDNPTLGPTVAVKYQTGKEKKADVEEILKELDKKDFAGLMIATNIGRDVGLTYIENAINNSLAISNKVTRPYVSDDGRTISIRTWTPSYDDRKALSVFFNASPLKDNASFYMTMTYDRIGDQGQVSGIRGEWVVDNEYSFSLAGARVEPGIGELDVFTGDVKVSLGENTRGIVSGIYGTYTQNLPYNYLDANRADYVKMIGGTFGVTSNGLLRRYFIASLLDKVADKNYYSGAEKREVRGLDAGLIRTYCDDLFGEVGLTAGAVVQLNRLGPQDRGGWGFSLSGKDFLTDNSILRLQSVGDFFEGSRYGSLDLVKGADYSILVMGGSEVPSKRGVRHKGFEGMGRLGVFGGGVRWNNPIGLNNFGLALQGAYRGDWSTFDQTTGLTYDDKANSLFVQVKESSRKEKEYYFANNLHCLVSYNRLGVFGLYDHEKEILNLSTTTAPDVLTKKVIGVGLTYINEAGNFAVTGSAIYAEKTSSLKQTKSTGVVGQLDVTYFRRGEENRLSIPNIVSQATLTFTTAGSSYMFPGSSSLSAQENVKLTLYFQP